MLQVLPKRDPIEVERDELGHLVSLVLVTLDTTKCVMDLQASDCNRCRLRHAVEKFVWVVQSPYAHFPEHTARPERKDG